MAKNGRKEAEDIILQALGHTERRGILRIIGANPDGVTYSSILGETELNTGHLNYHLRSLEGLIEKTDDRLYRFTPLGQKALGVMNNLSNEIDNEAIRYIEVAKSSQECSIHPLVKGLMYIGIVGIGIVFLASLGLLISTITRGSTSIIGIFVSLSMMGFTGAILWVLTGALKTVPEFVKRLERKLLKD